MTDEEAEGQWFVYHIPTSNMIGEYETADLAVNAVARECIWNAHLGDEAPKPEDFFIHPQEEGEDDPLKRRVPTKFVEEAMGNVGNWTIEEYDFNALRKAPTGKMLADVVTETQYHQGQRFILDDMDISMTQPAMVRVRTMVATVEVLDDDELEPHERAALEEFRIEKEAAYNEYTSDEPCEDCDEPAHHNVIIGEEVEAETPYGDKNGGYRTDV